MKITICERWKTAKTNLQTEILRLRAVVVDVANKVREECGQCAEGVLRLESPDTTDLGTVSIHWSLNPEYRYPAEFNVQFGGGKYTEGHMKNLVQQHSYKPLKHIEAVVELLRSQTAEAIELAVIASLIPKE